MCLHFFLREIKGIFSFCAFGITDTWEADVPLLHPLLCKCQYANEQRYLRRGDPLACLSDSRGGKGEKKSCFLVQKKCSLRVSEYWHLRSSAGIYTIWSLYTAEFRGFVAFFSDFFELKLGRTLVVGKWSKLNLFCFFHKFKYAENDAIFCPAKCS